VIPGRQFPGIPAASARRLLFGFSLTMQLSTQRRVIILELRQGVPFPTIPEKLGHD
jgi:hypothetical protein